MDYEQFFKRMTFDDALSILEQSIKRKEIKENEFSVKLALAKVVQKAKEGNEDARGLFQRITGKQI